MKKLQALPSPPKFSSDKKYAFLKIQYLSVDSVKYKDVDDGAQAIVDIINLQGTAKGKGYGPKIIRSMLDSFGEQLPKYLVLSPYLRKNPGLHKVYHEKWGMKYLSLSELDKKILSNFFGDEEVTKIQEEIKNNNVKNTEKDDPDPLKLQPQNGPEQNTYLIISTEDLLKNPKFEKGFDIDTLVDEEGDVERIDLTKEEYKDVIDFTLLKDKENIPIDKNQIRKNGDVQKNLKLTVGWDDENTHICIFIR